MLMFMRKRGQLVTIFTNERVSIVYQDTAAAVAADPVVEHLDVTSLDLVEQYHEWVCRRENGLHRGTVDRTWVVVRESFPYGSFEEDSHVWRMGADTWFRDFCDKLSPGLFPQKVHTGLDIIKAIYSQNEEIWRPGHGVFTVIGEKAFFMAYGENGTFVRISRNPLIREANAQVFRPDWLQQTRMLYSNRTGYKLGKIHIVAEYPLQISGVDEQDLEVDTLPCPATNADGCQLPVPVSGLVLLLRPPNNLEGHQLGVLQQRKCHHDVVRGLKAGVAMMLAGALVLLAGACKGGAFEKTGGHLLTERWNASVAEWQDTNRIWNEKSTSVRNRRLAILLTGSIGANLPERVRLTRIQVQKSSPVETNLEMTLEGRLDSPASPGAFQTWVDALVESGILEDVRNLQFNPQGTSLEFRLNAISRGVDAI